MSDALPLIVGDIEIARDLESVWRVLTDEALVPRWLGCLRYKRAIGHVFYMQQDQAKAAADDISGATHCEILALDAPRLFRFSWFFPGYPATCVSIALAPVSANATRVTLTHEGWDKFPADQIKPIRDMLGGGWKSFVLPNLKRVVEG